MTLSPMGRSRSRTLAWLSVALVALLASTWAVVGIALDGASTGVVSAGRTAFAAAGLALLVLVPRSEARRRTSQSGSRRHRYTPRQLAALAVTGVAGYTLLSTLAIRLAGPAIPSLVLALSPGVVMLLEAHLTRTRVRPGVLLATCLAIAGTIVFISPGLGEVAAGSTVVWGVVAATGAMLSMAAYGLYFAHVHRSYEGPLTPRILPIFALGSVPLFIWAVVDVLTGQQVTTQTVITLALLGLLIYVPAYVAQHRILLMAGPAYTALLGLAVPPLVAVASVLLGLAQPLSVLQSAGIALTLAGMAVVIRLRYGRSSPQPARARGAARP